MKDKLIIQVLIFALIGLSSCNYRQKKLENDLQEKILFFENNKNQFYELIEELEKTDLLLTSKTLNILKEDELNEKQSSLKVDLRIYEIKYGRYMTCEAMTEDLREMFFYLDDRVAIWYCPCIEQSDKKHYHDNSQLRGYKDLIDFNSLGLGGNWAIVEITD